MLHRKERTTQRFAGSCEWTTTVYDGLDILCVIPPNTGLCLRVCNRRSIIPLPLREVPGRWKADPKEFLPLYLSSGIPCRTYSVFLVISFEPQIWRSSKWPLTSSQKDPSQSTRRVQDARKSASICVHWSPWTILVNLDQKNRVRIQKIFKYTR